MKLVGIDNLGNLDDKTLQNDINLRNFDNFNNKCEVVHSYQNSKKKLKKLILEMPGDIHEHVKENYGKICIGYQSCKAFDMINVNLCYIVEDITIKVKAVVMRTAVKNMQVNM